MFDPEYELLSGRRSPLAIGGLAALSLVSLVVTLGILVELPREQQIVERLKEHLPAADRRAANELAGDLRLQSRLSVLLIANLVVSAVALTMLVRAFILSQRSLRNVRVFASDILTSLDQGVITTDQQTVVLSINPRGRELLEETEIGTELASNNGSPSHRVLAKMCREVLEKQDSIRDLDYVSRRNGTDRHLRAGCSLLRDHTGRQRGTVIYLLDVTEKTLMEQRLRRMERYMGLGSLAAGLQHEIKNPLSALSLHVQLLQESLAQEEVSAAVQESLGVLSAEVWRITGVLENFRDYASVTRLNREETDVRKLIERSITLAGPQARRQGVEIIRDFPEEDLLPISIDPIRIEQMMLNLILNALAAMPEGGTLTLHLRCESDTIVIEVADTGCGIPHDLREKIFEPYFTTRSAGTGLGTALCEKIVRQHEGTIRFVSGAEGTVFTVTLPKNVPT